MGKVFIIRNTDVIKLIYKINLFRKLKFLLFINFYYS
jgi:hypothetical protein